MKALSLWEPWATLMAIGAKRVETRSWATPYTGPLLICAALRHNKAEMRKLFEIEEFRGALRDVPLSFGKAVAVVHLDGCMCARAASYSLDKKEKAFGDYSTGRTAWMTSRLQRIQPFSFRGRRGVFDVGPAAEAKIIEIDSQTPSNERRPGPS